MEKEAKSVMIPMENFSLVCPGIYRSAFPLKKNFAFMQSLELRSILTLILEDYPPMNLAFAQEHNISLFQFGAFSECQSF